jgi:hypothetical protein
MESLEEFSSEKLKGMSNQEVYERLASLQEIQTAIEAEISKCRDRLGLTPKRVLPEKCEACRSTNLEPRKGGYLCRKCGYRKGLSSIIDVDAEQRAKMDGRV